MASSAVEILMRQKEGDARLREIMRGPLFTELLFRPWRELFGRRRRPAVTNDMQQMIDDLARQGYPPPPRFGWDDESADFPISFSFQPTAAASEHQRR